MPRGSKRLTVRASAPNLPCTQRGCPRTFRNESGRTKHVRTMHPKFDGHRLPVNLQEVLLESPTSSVSGSSPMMPSLPAPGPEQYEQEPEEYIRGLKRTYHPFINGFIHYPSFYKIVCLYFSLRSTMRCKWELPPWRNPTTTSKSKKVWRLDSLWERTSI